MGPREWSLAGLEGSGGIYKTGLPIQSVTVIITIIILFFPVYAAFFHFFLLYAAFSISTFDFIFAFYF